MARTGSKNADVKTVPVRNGCLEIREGWCKGCGLCVDACSRGVLHVGELGKVQVCSPEKCVLCGQCEAVCPDFAIRMKKENG